MVLSVHLVKREGVEVIQATSSLYYHVHTHILRLHYYATNILECIKKKVFLYSRNVYKIRVAM